MSHLDEYEHVRSRANWFLVAVGHEGRNGGTAEEHGAHEIVAKEGEAGRIAEEDDPRR